MKNVLLAAAAGLLSSCVDDAPLAALASEAQCGPGWDVQDVERYDGTLGVSQAFVAVAERRVGYHLRPGCSGTLVSDDLFVSAGHCGYQVGDVVRFDYQLDGEGGLRKPRDFAVSEVVEQENDGTWDYAVVRLAGSPGREYGHASVAPVDPPVGSTVTVIQHPGRSRKQVHAGPVLDYASAVGPNWFRHQVDTQGGSSGAGVLDAHGRLVGIHTNAGCGTGLLVGGNSAIRMSQLVARSPTLAALARTRLVWRDAGGKIAVWSLWPDGSLRSRIEHGPYPGWSPVGLAGNRLLWRHEGGAVSLWTLDDHGEYLRHVEYGPYAGWTAVAYADDRLLWRHADGRIAYWVLDAAGKYVSGQEHGPYAGWTAVAAAGNRILWRHETGKAWYWVVDEAGYPTAAAEYGPFPGWTAEGVDNGGIFWRGVDGGTSHWAVDRLGQPVGHVDHEPMAGWTPVAHVDGHLLWRHTSGKIQLWSTGSDGAALGAVEHALPGWTALLTTGGTP